MSTGEHEIDTTAAEAYEAHLVPAIFRPWAEVVVGLAAPKPGEHVLDVACGTGIGARIAAEAVAPNGKVVGLDIDPGMVKIARRSAVQSGATTEWYCGSAIEMPFANETFDLCLCLQGLQFFPDRAQGFSELRWVLRPTGRLVASIWWPIEHNKGNYDLAQALERQNVDAAAVKRPFSFGDAEEIRKVATQAGFKSVEIQTEERLSRFPSVEGFIDSLASGGPASRHALAQLPDEGRQDLVKDVKEILEPYVKENELNFPMRTHVVIATL